MSGEQSTSAVQSSPISDEQADHEKHNKKNATVRFMSEQTTTAYVYNALWYFLSRSRDVTLPGRKDVRMSVSKRKMTWTAVTAVAGAGAGIGVSLVISGLGST